MYNFNNVLVAAGVNVEITPYLAISAAAIQIVTAVIVSVSHLATLLNFKNEVKNRHVQLFFQRIN